MKKISIVAFAFGTPSTNSSNTMLSELASKAAKDHAAQVYTQCDLSLETGIDVTYSQEICGNPPPTLRIARGAVEWAELRGIEELVIVAALPHLWRCRRDLKRAVREKRLSIKVSVYPAVTAFPYSIQGIWFCPDSTQERTSSWWAWNKRELILRILPFSIYQRVAS